ncbi:MAG: hypothetical protein GC202_02080 [Alphaproteobacteria bacterium]|nr:hypothetical protein [Alphaproteobacteria bacterium]
MRFTSPTAGELRHRLAMETLSQGASGGSSGTGLTSTYTVAVSLWGRVLGLAGGRYVAGQQSEEKVATHRITVRWVAGFAGWTHVSETPSGGGTRRFAIRSVQDPEGRNRWLELDVEEEKPA